MQTSDNGSNRNFHRTSHKEPVRHEYRQTDCRTSMSTSPRSSHIEFNFSPFQSSFFHMALESRIILRYKGRKSVYGKMKITNPYSSQLNRLTIAIQCKRCVMLEPKIKHIHFFELDWLFHM
jgi:hypothetical protein